MALRVLNEFICVWSHLHIIRMSFFYHFCWGRFLCFLYFICICGKKLIPASRYIPPIHQGLLLSINLLPGWMSSRLCVGAHFVWVFAPHLSVVSFPWCFLNWPFFTHYYDLYIYLYLWRWPMVIILSMIHNSFYTSITFIYPFFCPVCYLYFHFYDAPNGTIGPSLGCVIFEIYSFLKYSRRGSDFS